MVFAFSVLRRASCGLALVALSAGTAGCAAPAPPPVVAPPLEPPPQKSITEAEAELSARIRAVVVAERARLRACYEEGLARTPSLAGRVVLFVEIGQSGMATHVHEAHRVGLGDVEVHCFARVLKAARFHDGAASAVTIQVPLVFTPDPSSVPDR